MSDTRWTLHQYRDKDTQALVGLEIEPVEDTKAHMDSPDCECIPNVKWERGIPILIHSAFDGRDVNEKLLRGN